MKVHEKNKQTNKHIYYEISAFLGDAGLRIKQFLQILGESLFCIMMYQLLSNGVITVNAHEPIHE